MGNKTKDPKPNMVKIPLYEYKAFCEEHYLLAYVYRFLTTCDQYTDVTPLRFALNVITQDEKSALREALGLSDKEA